MRSTEEFLTNLDQKLISDNFFGGLYRYYTSAPDLRPVWMLDRNDEAPLAREGTFGEAGAGVGWRTFYLLEARTCLYLSLLRERERLTAGAAAGRACRRWRRCLSVCIY
jgi:hypothetical protein